MATGYPERHECANLKGMTIFSISLKDKGTYLFEGKPKIYVTQFH